MFSNRHLLRFSFDGETYTSSGIEEAKIGHIHSGLAVYKNKLLTTGGGNKTGGSTTIGNKTELLDMTTYKWSDADDFPAM